MHYFQDTLNPLCKWGKDIELKIHFLLHWNNFPIPRQTLFQKIENIEDNILSASEMQLTQTFLAGNQNYHLSINRLINNLAIKYLILTKRCKHSVFN